MVTPGAPEDRRKFVTLAAEACGRAALPPSQDNKKAFHRHFRRIHLHGW